jgi:UDP-N-acetylglucosamine--N-acetylmuramyl-(pentapeptide) pyrophosphoryl-undecaprenol N-acetylglucosamine transferase
MIYAITGGGTGGHLAIAKALKREIVKRGDKVVFIGSSNGQDQSWFENESDFEDKIFLPSYGVTNRKGFEKMKSLWNIFKLSLSLRKIFHYYRFDAVISVGGYSSAPASLTAILTRTPFFIHEQNALIGSLNKVLKPFAKQFFSSYLKSSTIKDYPISDIFFELARVRKDIKNVIFLGGSQGAKFINDFAIKVAPELHKRGISIIHQTGRGDYERIKNAYSKLEIDNVEIIDFHPELFEFISKADLAVSRSGASTLWELSANGLPAMFIPYPLANNHQWFNAKFILDKGFGWLFPQDEVKPENLYSILEENLEDKSRGLIESISPKGVSKIVDRVEEIVKFKE